jgi:hypothetical protein
VTTASIPVELWAPLQPIPQLLQDLCAARLEPVLLPEPDAACLVPLLVVYPDPISLLACLSPWNGSPPPPAAQLFPQLAQLDQLERSARPWRLVNGSCISAPALVAWCVDPQGTASPAECQPRFLPVPPLAGVLARELISQHSGWLEAYRQLEHHPRAAALDGRPPDDHCLERLAEAWDGPAALRTWQEQQHLQQGLTDLLEAGDRLAALQLENDRLQSLREQLIQNDASEAALQEELQACRTASEQQQQQLGRRCDELSLSLAAADQDREALIQRLELLEGLVARAASASRRQQGLLPRLLT